MVSGGDSPYQAICFLPAFYFADKLDDIDHKIMRMKDEQEDLEKTIILLSKNPTPNNGKENEDEV